MISCARVVALTPLCIPAFQMYGPPGSPNYQQKLTNFVQSMAGYSIATYLAQVKDRSAGPWDHHLQPSLHDSFAPFKLVCA